MGTGWHCKPGENLPNAGRILGALSLKLATTAWLE